MANSVPRLDLVRDDVPANAQPLRVDYADASDEPANGEELVERLLPGPGSVVAFVGPSGSGKTQVASRLAVEVQTGGLFFGRQVVRGNVLYLSPEAPGSVRNRLLAYRRDRSLEELAIAIYGGALDLHDAAQLDGDAIIATAKEHAANLIVVDTLARSFGIGDENAASDMGAVMNTAARIARASASTVVLVHHQGKEPGRGPRGSSAFYAALDACVEVLNDGGLISIRISKSRDGVAGEELCGRLRVIDLGARDRWGNAITSCVLDDERARPTSRPRPSRLPKGCELAFQALKSAITEFGEIVPATSAIPPGTRAVDIAVWRRAYADRDALDVDSTTSQEARDRAMDARGKRFTRARMTLLENNAIGSHGALHWIVDPSPRRADATGQDPDKSGQIRT